MAVIRSKVNRAIMGHRRKSRMGTKTRALQNLADEVETFYAQYRAMRMKLGPLPDPMEFNHNALFHALSVAIVRTAP